MSIGSRFARFRGSCRLCHWRLSFESVDPFSVFLDVFLQSTDIFPLLFLGVFELFQSFTATRRIWSL